MKILFALDTPVLIGIIAGGVALLLLIALFFYLFLFSHRSLKKQVRELNRRFEYFHGLLFGQDASYIKHIENIAATNLTYVNTHMNFSRRFKDVRDNVDAAAQNEIDSLKDFLADRDYRSLKAELPAAKEAVDLCEKEVNALNDDILVVVGPGEECRQQSFQVKEKMRKIKQDYFVKQADLTLAAASFERAFSLLEENFSHFESLVESAHYEEARVLLPKMEAVLNELSKILIEMPNLCTTLQVVIPEKITSLSNRFDEMERDGYPLHHLLTKVDIDALNVELAELCEKVKNFQLDGVQSQLDGMLARIEDYFAAFDQEKDARVAFEAEYDRVYEQDSTVENRYIRLSNLLPELRKIYSFSQETQAKIDGIKTLVNAMGATRRSLDTLVHSGSHQPYTILLEKMHALRDESDKTSQALDDFNQKLLSLKDQAEGAAKDLKEYESRVRYAEYKLRQICVPAVSEAYESRIQGLYLTMDDIKDNLKAPVDVEKIASLASSLRSEGDEVVLGIDERYEAMIKADNALLFANRERQHMSEVKVLCNQAETLYWSGDFQGAFDTLSNGIRQYRGE